MNPKVPSQVRRKIEEAQAALAAMSGAPADSAQTPEPAVGEPAVATQVVEQQVPDPAATTPTVTTTAGGDDALDSPKDQSDGFELAKQYEHKWQTIKGRLKASEKREAEAVARVEALTAEVSSLKTELEAAKSARQAPVATHVSEPASYREVLTDEEANLLSPEAYALVEKLAMQAELRAEAKIAAAQAELKGEVAKVHGTLTEQEKARARGVSETFGKLAEEVEPRIRTLFQNPLWEDYLESEVHGVPVHELMQRNLERGHKAVANGNLAEARKAAEAIKALAEPFARRVSTPSAPGALRSAPSSAAGGVPAPRAEGFDEQKYIDSVKAFSQGKISRAQHGEVKKQYDAALAAGTLKRVQRTAA